MVRSCKTRPLSIHPARELNFIFWGKTTPSPPPPSALRHSPQGAAIATKPLADLRPSHDSTTNLYAGWPARGVIPLKKLTWSMPSSGPPAGALPIHVVQPSSIERCSRKNSLLARYMTIKFPLTGPSMPKLPNVTCTSFQFF